jgi:hypothetical protein
MRWVVTISMPPMSMPSMLERRLTRMVRQLGIKRSGLARNLIEESLVSSELGIPEATLEDRQIPESIS